MSDEPHVGEWDAIVPNVSGHPAWVKAVAHSSGQGGHHASPERPSGSHCEESGAPVPVLHGSVAGCLRRKAWQQCWPQVPALVVYRECVYLLSENNGDNFAVVGESKFLGSVFVRLFTGFSSSTDLQNVEGNLPLLNSSLSIYDVV